MRYRSYLLPALFILVGLLALLVNVGAIPTDRLYRLADLWPLLLIVLGLELLVNRARLPSAVDTTASVLIVALALAGATLYVALGPRIPAGTHTMTTTIPGGGVQQATLEVDVGGSKVHVQGSTSLDQDLLQAQITYSGPQPTVSFDHGSGRVVVSQNGRVGYFGPASFAMDVQLNVATRWSFAIHSGASHDTYDLANVDLAAMEIDTGASTEDITLPHPTGTVPLKINGGALTVRMHRPTDAGASVKVSGGAVTLNFDGDRTTAIGSVSHTTGSDTDRFEVTVNGGTCNVTMDTGLG
jgi:Domain of unknown function (DUF5668)